MRIEWQVKHHNSYSRLLHNILPIHMVFHSRKLQLSGVLHLSWILPTEWWSILILMRALAWSHLPKEIDHRCILLLLQWICQKIEWHLFDHRSILAVDNRQSRQIGHHNWYKFKLVQPYRIHIFHPSIFPAIHREAKFSIWRVHWYFLQMEFRMPNLILKVEIYILENQYLFHLASA